jgi:hypothetical protein
MVLLLLAACDGKGCGGQPDPDYYPTGARLETNPQRNQENTSDSTNPKINLSERLRNTAQQYEKLIFGSI